MECRFDEQRILITPPRRNRPSVEIDSEDGDWINYCATNLHLWQKSAFLPSLAWRNEFLLQEMLNGV